MHPCEEVRESIAEFQNGLLGAEASKVVQAHLRYCGACQSEATLRQRLQKLSQEALGIVPTRDLWKEAGKAWKRQDAARQQRYHLRFALAGACVLLLVMSGVLANRMVSRSFPVEDVVHDFQQVSQHLNASQCSVGDANAVTQCLRKGLGEEIPQFRMPDIGATLVGGDILQTSTLKVARLVYEYDTKDGRGRLAIYVAPRGVQFPGLTAQTSQGRSFFFKNTKDFQLKGWDHNRTGYALVAPEAVADKFAREAQIESGVSE